MTQNEPRLSIGVAAAIGSERMRALAPRAEAAGFDGLWINDTPAADALSLVREAASVTDELHLATGVVPVDRRPPQQLAADVRALDLRPGRFTLGIGSGRRRRGALDGVAAAIPVLREATESTGAPIVVGALGPRMRRLAASSADGVLLSWLTPEVAAEQALDVSAQGGRSILYVRCALDEAAHGALRAESAAYAGYPQYARNFARMGVAADATVIAVRTPEELPDIVAPYLAAVDEVVLRAIVADDTEQEDARFIDAVTASGLLD